jgi:hypothetical protein
VDVALTLLLPLILLPAIICAVVILRALRPRGEELVVAASGFVVIRH